MDNQENQGATTPILPTKKEKENKTISQNRRLWIFGGFLIMALIIALGGLIGYQNGIQQRIAQEESTILLRAADQYERGLVDLAEGRYEIAQQRFEYVIQLNPVYPGAADKLVEVLIIINTLATPTPLPTPTSSQPTPTPTPDFRGAEEIYLSVVQMIQDSQWDEAILTMELLRQKFLDYRPIDVDGLYYIALCNRGIQKILVDGSLEPGIYDLSLAERFAPLDADAESFRTWARLYLTGASYWEVNWEQVIYYFSQIYLALPNLRDGSGVTATERYRQAAIKYADQIALTEDWCKAQEYYDLALSLGNDPRVQPTAAWVAEQCWNQQNPTAIPKTRTPTGTLENGVPTETPTPTPTTPPP